MKRTPSHLPQMRENGLVVDDLPDEVLVYDLESHRAHCLNRSAALVWRACDGNSTPAAIARRLTAELDTPFSEDLVLLALNQLEKQQLLQPTNATALHFAVLSRRQMVRRLGLATAVAVPLVTSILAPRAVEAATCNPPGITCSPSKLCCSPLGCNPVGNVCF
ncbi:MAG TPA: PqqD family protein [Pyrinomonadaceae bacterium]|nr:PqqD family protein [Pyrinomonadaceae bacterium]